MQDIQLEQTMVEIDQWLNKPEETISTHFARYVADKVSKIWQAHQANLECSQHHEDLDDGYLSHSRACALGRTVRPDRSSFLACHSCSAVCAQCSARLVLNTAEHELSHIAV